MTRRRPNIGRVVASLAIAIGFVLVFVGLNASVTGKDAQRLPDELESIQPVRNATQVLSQEQVQVDLAASFTGILIINGIEIDTFSLANLGEVESTTAPGAQVDLPLVTIFEPGNFTLSFTPIEGAPIEAFETGVNTVELRYWKIVEGREFAKTFTWQFDVV